MTGLATWGGLEVRVVGGLTGFTGHSISARFRSRETTPVCMINDPGLRTVVGTGIPMSDSARVEGVKVVDVSVTLSFSCKAGTLFSGLSTIC